MRDHSRFAKKVNRGVITQRDAERREGDLFPNDPVSATQELSKELETFKHFHDGVILQYLESKCPNPNMLRDSEAALFV